MVTKKIGKQRTIVFVDYEHWFWGVYNKFGETPDVKLYLSTQNSPMWLLKIPPLNNKSYAFIELSTVFYVISLIVTMQSMIVSI